MDKTDPLANMHYISINEDVDREIGDFQIRPDILLPVEIPPGEEEWELSDLSWEAIISGMLKILAYDRSHEHAEYYREFILGVRPDIGADLSEAGTLKARNKDFDIAIEVFRSLEGLFPRDPRHTLNLALIYEERADHYGHLERQSLEDEFSQRAFDTYKQALEVDPSFADSHLYIANFHLKQQNFKRAHQHLRDFLALKPSDKKKRREAEKLIHEIESRNLMDELFREAYDQIKLNKEERGIEKIRQFLDANPEVWNAWFLLGWAYRRIGRYDNARDSFKRVLDLGERNIDTLNELSICHMELGALKESKTCLEQALRMDSENIKILSNLGILALKEGKDTDAESYFRLVLDIDPEDLVARRYIDKLRT